MISTTILSILRRRVSSSGDIHQIMYFMAQAQGAEWVARFVRGATVGHGLKFLENRGSVRTCPHAGCFLDGPRQPHTRELRAAPGLDFEPTPPSLDPTPRAAPPVRTSADVGP